MNEISPSQISVSDCNDLNKDSILLANYYVSIFLIFYIVVSNYEVNSIKRKYNKLRSY